MIYIVINKKGGVGKSTFSNQILSSYLFNKNGKKTKLVEVDDENNDNASFSKTEIMNCDIIPTSSIKKIDEIFFDDEDTIIDIGGNKTATIFLDEMKKINEFENVIWFVPLGAGEQDNLNALETHDDIKNLDENAKVIFVLSRATTNDLEWEFVNFFGNEFLNTKFAISNQLNINTNDDNEANTDTDDNEANTDDNEANTDDNEANTDTDTDDNEAISYLVIKSNAIVSNSRYFQKTAFDLSLNDTDFRARAKAEDNKQKRRKHIFMNRVKNEAVEYVKYLKNSVFTKLDKLL